VSDYFGVSEAEEMIRDRFAEIGIEIVDLATRSYPDEVVFIVQVLTEDLPQAAEIGNALDRDLFEGGIQGFITVRSAPETQPRPITTLKRGVHETLATELVQLISARSRTSDIQPSLSYVRDAAANIAVATAPRNHLIFGRRGAGKTSLMVETKRLVEADGHLTVWINMQTYRLDELNRVFLWSLRKLFDVMEVEFQSASHPSQLAASVAELGVTVDGLLAEIHPDDTRVRQLIPPTQAVVRRFLDSHARRIYVFLDDFHYLPRRDQPYLLDMVHAVFRDSDAWLKVAGIRHLSRWFQAEPGVGLQTTHDADHIDLDVSLEDPIRAKTFLEEVLQKYAAAVGIRTLSGLFQPAALNRLVLASGAVPRDFLVLSAASITRARTRQNAKLVGVQDVNRAAGDAAQVKIRELEDDFASDAESTGSTLAGLDVVRAFCLDQKRWTYFRIDFKDKERAKDEYDIISNLLDARLVHLISAGVSETHRAGERSEVFMLDLSQFSGQRLRKHIRVLDFESGHIVSRATGEGGQPQVGDSARRLVTIFRRAPVLHLTELTPVLTNGGNLTDLVLESNGAATPPQASSRT
jgi:hypothetical protein